ncbi:hypothetical protein [Streptomyces sp. NPDC059009]|uniref:hypothetical protein n=1 Tax=Streptomyces sp. NPDC059009 TaxID=3346694 RepID=UPI0036C46442
MGTKTVDEAAKTAKDAEATEAEAKDETAKDEAGKDEAAKDEAAEPADAAVEVSKGDAAGTAADLEEDEDDTEDELVESAAPAKTPGVGQGAAAVVAAALGVIGLSGGWIGTVASARENLMGQLKTAQSASVGKQVEALYGDAWHATALYAGAFALAALVVGVVVLARPAFGVPGRPQAPWIKSVAWAGVALGVLGLLLAIAKYTDLLLGLPSTS